MFSENRSISVCEPQSSLIQHNRMQQHADSPEVIQVSEGETKFINTIVEKNE